MLTRLLRTYLSRYKRELVLVVVLQLLATAAMLYLPTLNADIIDYGVARGDTDYILHTGVVMLAVTLAQVFGSVVAIYFGARAAMATGRDIRHDLAHRVNDFSQREMGKFGAPSLITRTTNDVQQVQMLAVMSVSLVIMAPIMCIGGVIMGIRVAPGMWWVLAVAVPILGVFMTVAINRMIPGFRAMQERIDTVNRVLREQITGIRVVRAFVREPEEIERFGVANDLLASAALRVGRIFAMVFPVVMGVTNVTMVAIIWVGGHQIVDGKMEIGALTALMSYVMQILMAVMMVSFLAMMAPRAAVCAERIMEVLETPTSVAPPPYPVGFTSDPAEVEFHDAAFAYPGADEPVLTNLTFTCRPGTTTAIVGSTGSGKSTLVSLIPRLIDTTAGAVTVGGTPVADLDPDLLRSVIGVVPQRPYLFSGTVASNLRYGRAEATDEELWEALRIAQGVKAGGATLFRGGAYKPRTSPYAFQGLETEGILDMVKAREATGLPIVSELMSEDRIPEFEEYVDVVQIGARNMQNFQLLKAVGKMHKPVLLKRGLCNTIEEWIMSAEYIMAGGNEQVILCERGIRTFEKYTRNTLDLSAVPIIHEKTHLPIIVDPSHATGYTRYVEPMALAATACGANGLEIEVHDEPSRAWSDGAQALTPDQFDDTMRRIRAIREVVCQETME